MPRTKEQMIAKRAEMEAEQQLKNKQDFSTRLEMLEDVVYNHPDDIEGMAANIESVYDGTATFMSKVAFAQSDVDILSKRIIKIEAALKLTKEQLFELTEILKCPK